MPTFKVEYSKSNRAGCKSCKAKIEKGVLRIGTLSTFNDYESWSWQHLDCWAPRSKPDPEEIQDYDALDEEGAAQLKARCELIQGGGAKRTPKKKKKKKQEEDEDEEEEAEEEETPKKKRGRRGEPATPSTPGTPNNALATPSSARTEAEREEAARVAAAIETASQYTVPQLKAALRHNGMLVGGTKSELINRVADAIVYGRLPKCKECGGGFLRVTYETRFGHGGQGSWYCPGYYDDTRQVRCGERPDTAERPPFEWPAGEGPAAATGA